MSSSTIAQRTWILWVVRVTWITIPLSAGGVIEEALAGWSRGARILSFALLFTGWAVGVAAMLTPRPRSFTIARVAAPVATTTTLAAVLSDWSLPALLSLVHVAVASGGLVSSWSADACADGASYGSERRTPLRLPVHFSAFVVPVTVIVAVFGFVSGPLLLADTRWVSGAVITVFGWPLAYSALRSLIGLERRFIVLVPAGVVLADSLVLIDPVMVPREHIVGLGPCADVERTTPTARPGVLDLRLGLRRGLEITADEPAMVPVRAGRKNSATVSIQRFLCSPVVARAILDGLSPRSGLRSHSGRNEESP